MHIDGERIAVNVLVKVLLLFDQRLENLTGLGHGQLSMTANLVRVRLCLGGRFAVLVENAHMRCGILRMRRRVSHQNRVENRRAFDVAGHREDARVVLDVL